ncbi:unnamed protein product [Sphagnum jensenii]|uniref:Uncharacterized protein n=1 Tax=Sphagnum jensenii TaxID=128206 RepID=A0ABP1A722_9BRYO
MRQSSTTLFSMTSSALAVIAAPIRASNLTAGPAETLQVDRKEGPQKTELGRQYPVGIEFWKVRWKRETAAVFEELGNERYIFILTREKGALGCEVLL